MGDNPKVLDESWKLLGDNSKIILFYHLPPRGRAGVKLGDVDTLQMYL